MTVAELKEELGFYEDDDEVIFEVDDEFEPEEITESKYGWRAAEGADFPHDLTEKTVNEVYKLHMMAKQEQEVEE